MSTQKPLPDFPLLLSPAAAAAYVGVGEKHFKRLMRQGVFPEIRTGANGGRVKLRRSDLDAWVAGLETSTTGEAA